MNKAKSIKTRASVFPTKILSNYIQKTGFIAEEHIKKIDIGTNEPLISNSNDDTNLSKIVQFMKNEIEDPSTQGIEDGRLTRLYFKKVNLSDLSCAVFSLIGVVLSILCYDVNFVTEGGYTEYIISINETQSKLIKNLLLWLVLLTTMALIPLTITRYQMKLKWMKARKIIGSNETLISTFIFKNIVLEIFIIVLIPNPFFQNLQFSNYNDVVKLTFYYEINDIFSLLVLARVVLIFRIFMANTVYYNNQSHRISELYGSDLNYMYLMKILMKNHPIQLILSITIAIVMLFAYALKICERPIITSLKASGRDDELSNNIGNYYNAIWCMVITMATVGYGDYYPRTTPGRALGFVICIFGSTSVSFLAVALQNILELKSQEYKASTTHERLFLKHEIAKEAAYLITYTFKLNLIKKRIEEYNWNSIKNIVQKQKIHKEKFLALSKELKFFQENANYHEETSRNFEFLNENLKSLKEKVIVVSELNYLFYEFHKKTVVHSKTTNNPYFFENIQNNISKEKVFNENNDDNINNTIEKKIETPLLNKFMKFQRIKQYKEKTEKFESGISIVKQTQNEIIHNFISSSLKKIDTKNNVVFSKEEEPLIKLQSGEGEINSLYEVDEKESQ